MMRKHAFTLIEMVVSLTVVSIVFLSMGSVMMMATKAIPDPDAPANLLLEANNLLEQMASELEVATTVTAASATEIEFTVPDRDNDTNDEAIKYTWSGTPGDPLLRQFNGGGTVPIMDGIKALELMYQTHGATATITSAELELNLHDPAANSRNYAIKSDQWLAQGIAAPGLPGNAVSWSVTRVSFRARSKGAAIGESLVQLRTANPDGSPSNTVLEEHTLYESALGSSYGWQHITFSNVTGIDPTDTLCLVIQHVSDADACEIEYDNLGSGGFFESDDTGANWWPFADKSLVYYTYGTHDTPDPASLTGDLNCIGITLTPSDDPASQARATVATLNRPTMP